MELSSLLRDAIPRAGESFAKDELAFLALTSKVERPFLDRLAFQLHSTLQTTGSVVAREYPLAAGVRADVAILRKGQPITAIEGKAMYTADCVEGRGRGPQYPKRMHADLQRYRSASDGDLQVFTLLLGTHPNKQIPQSLRRVIKYWGLVNRGFKAHGNPAELERIANVYLGAR